METPKMPSPQLRFETRQTQTLTPRLQYAVRLLQLSSLEYEQELRNMVDRNPFLDTEDSNPDQTVSLDEDWQAPAETARNGDGDGDGDDFGAGFHGDFAAEATEAPGMPDADDAPMRDNWSQLPGTVRDGAKESRIGALDLMAADVDLRMALRAHANLLPLSPRDHAIVCALVESLDDDGYLRTSEDEIVNLLGLTPRVEDCELSTALKLVQSFDPPGVGARNVGECLLLQLERLDERHRALAQQVIGSHLDRLAHRDVPGIARATGRPVAEVDEVCKAIRRLDPRPGWRFGRSDAEYIVPDLVVRKSRGTWTINLNASVVPKVHLNQSYADLFQRHRQSGQGELAGHLQEARWAVRNAEQRFSTILMVGEAILKRQIGFFEFGPLGMKPLGLREVAEEVGIHESTVCRVTNNKYMATPTGVFELKQFFSRSLPMASGASCSATAIRGVIREVVAGENPDRPLTDVEITQRLARQGLAVARRTVTKYRQMLQIDSVERRRRHGHPVNGGNFAALLPNG